MHDVYSHSSFTDADGANAAGFTYLRVPLGASDFSAKGTPQPPLENASLADGSHRPHAVYSFDDVSGDVTLTSFDINRAPSYLFSVINDVLSINSGIRIHVLPWSPVCIRLSSMSVETD